MSDADGSRFQSENGIARQWGSWENENWASVSESLWVRRTHGGWRSHAQQRPRTETERRTVEEGQGKRTVE
eukprot:2100543-Rhodomonas_salina.2